MNKIKQIPLSERPREKLAAKGPAALSDRELIAALLGRGTRKHGVMVLADKLLALVDEKGIGLSLDDITDIPGIGQARAAGIAAAFEFVRRRIRPQGLKIKRPMEVLPLLQHYGDRKQEHFLSVSLNGANEVTAVRVVTIGLVNQSQIHPREVFADPIAERAAAVIVAHNHPSGNLTPSSQDRAVTRRIKEAGALLGIPLLDHIIFHTSGYYSFAEHDHL